MLRCWLRRINSLVLLLRCCRKKTGLTLSSAINRWRTQKVPTWDRGRIVYPRGSKPGFSRRVEKCKSRENRVTYLATTYKSRWISTRSGPQNRGKFNETFFILTSHEMRCFYKGEVTGKQLTALSAIIPRVGTGAGCGADTSFRQYEPLSCGRSSTSEFLHIRLRD